MNHERVVLEQTLRFEGRPESVFPLLCPVREYEWIETWKCTMVHSVSGFAEPDCVFRTDFPQDGPTDTWVVSRYEAPSLIEFIRINPLRTIRYTITLREVAEGKTESVWRQVITGLSGEGDGFVRSLSGAAFTQRMRMIERMMNHYLTTGEMLRLSGL